TCLSLRLEPCSLYLYDALPFYLFSLFSFAGQFQQSFQCDSDGLPLNLVAVALQMMTAGHTHALGDLPGKPDSTYRFFFTATTGAGHAADGHRDLSPRQRQRAGSHLTHYAFTDRPFSSQRRIVYPEQMLFRHVGV